MMEIGLGVSQEKDSTLAAKEAVLNAKKNLRRGEFDLVIVFSSTDLSSPNLLKTVYFYTQQKPLIGSSGAAIFTNQGILNHGVAVMLIRFPEGAHFATSCTKNIKEQSGLEAGETLGEQLLRGFKDTRRMLSVILSDALIEESSNLIYGLQEKLGKSFPLLGGSASDNITFLKTCLYFNHELFDNGCVGLLLGGRLNFGLGIKHGWKPIGKPHTVTLSHGNIVEQIDNEPAVTLYKEYLGYNLTKLKKELKSISILYPIGIHVPGERELLLRNVISVEEGNFLRFQGNVPKGSLVRLMISTKEACLNATKEAAEDARDGLKDSISEFKKETVTNFVLVFSSISRYILLKRDAKKEIEILRKNFGENTPIIGLYTYGEVAPLMAINYLGQVYLHNQTITVLTIGS